MAGRGDSATYLCYLAIELAKHVYPTAIWVEVQVSRTRARWQHEMPHAVACTEKRPTRGIKAIDPHAIGAEVGHERPFLAPRIEANLMWMAALLSIPQRGVGCGQRMMLGVDSVADSAVV